MPVKPKRKVPDTIACKMAAAWRVYDAVCQLGLADVDDVHKTFVQNARKTAFAVYQELNTMYEEHSAVERKPRKRGGR